MSQPAQRSIVYRINKFQKIYFIPVLLAFMLGCAVSWLSLFFFLSAVYPLNPDFERLRDWVPVLLSAAAILMILMIFWTSRLTNRYWGCYERILHELDEVLAGRSDKPLEARKSDVVFVDLFRRINALIQRRH